MNNHSLIEKYTKFVMKRLYNVDVQVFFYDMKNNLRAIFREKGLPPNNIDVEEWDKTKCNITFDSKIFSINGELPEHTWKTIVHEVSHFKIGISQGNRGLRHNIDFNNLFRKNLRKVKDLEIKFEKELNETSG
jgi:hypothetical protein